MNWNTEGNACFACMSTIMNNLLKLPLNSEREGKEVSTSYLQYLIRVRLISNDAVNVMKRKFAPWGRELSKKIQISNFLGKPYTNHMPIFIYFWTLSDLPKKTRGLSCLQPFNDIACKPMCNWKAAGKNCYFSQRSVATPSSFLPAPPPYPDYQ